MISMILNLVARGIGVLGGVILSIAVARLAGPDGLGAFAVFLSVIGALSILSRCGKDMLLIRAVAWADGRAGAGAPVTLLSQASRRMILPSLLLGALGSALLSSGWLGRPFPGTVALMPLILPFLTFLALVAGYAKGRSRAWLAPLFETGGVSLLAAFGLAVFALLFTPSAATVTYAFLAALVVSGLAALAMIWRDMPRSLRLPALSPDQIADLRRGQVDFTLIALAMFLTQTGIFLLAAPFLSAADLGLLRAAERLALLVSFPLLAIKPVIAPRIVRLARSGDGAGLRRVMGQSMLLSSGIGLPVLLVLLIWPERALSLMGAEFTAAAPYLQVVALARLVVGLLDPLATLLNMSGRERVSMWINVGALGFAIVFIPLMCMGFGAPGFVMAYSMVVLVRLTLVCVAVVSEPRRSGGGPQ